MFDVCMCVRVGGGGEKLIFEHALTHISFVSGWVAFSMCAVY